MPNNDLLFNIQAKLKELETKQDRTEKAVNRLKIDNQMMIERNTRISPGVATKVAFDFNGLIVGTSSLTSTDIPTLPLQKIQGLEELLETKASIGDINRLKLQLMESTKKDIISDTGCKVNVDPNGHVVSTSNLLPSDIPTLPLDKIEGVDKVINELRAANISNAPSRDPAPVKRIAAGSACKIKYDENGFVVDGGQLTMGDMPNELISQLNRIESSLNNMAPKESIDILSRSVSEKMDSNRPIQAGIYTKVGVDSRGLVTSGSTLSKKDLPQLSIRDIEGLKDTIDKKAEKTEVRRLNESIATIMNSLSTVGEVANMKSDLNKKANVDELGEIKREIKELKAAVNRILLSLPDINKRK